MKRLAFLLVLVGGTLHADELPARALRRFQVTDSIPRSSVTALAFQPDGKSLLVAPAGMLCEWDLKKNSAPPRIPTRFSAIGLTPDCRFAAVGTYGQIQFHELPKDTDRGAIHSTNSVNTVALSPDGSLLAGGNDVHTVEVWDT